MPVMLTKPGVADGPAADAWDVGAEEASPVEKALAADQSVSPVLPDGLAAGAGGVDAVAGAGGVAGPVGAEEAVRPVVVEVCGAEGAGGGAASGGAAGA